MPTWAQATRRGSGRVAWGGNSFGLAAPSGGPFGTAVDGRLDPVAGDVRGGGDMAGLEMNDLCAVELLETRAMPDPDGERVVTPPIIVRREMD